MAGGERAAHRPNLPRKRMSGLVDGGRDSGRGHVDADDPTETWRASNVLVAVRTSRLSCRSADKRVSWGIPV